jgi:cyclic pyranopterin phosphate synthase
MEALVVNPACSDTTLTLRISVTDRCNMRCLYCSPAPARPLGPRHELLSFEEIVRVVQVARRLFHPLAVRLTGGEPLLRRDLPRLVALLAAGGVDDLALTTNGQLLAAQAMALRAAGLRRVNLSLDSLNPHTFRQISGCDLQPTLEGLEAALACGLQPVKLNTVVLRGVNEGEVCALARFALSLHCELRFIELMPFGPAGGRHRDWFVSSAQVRQQLESEFEIGPELAGPHAPARRFAVRCRTTGLQGVLGFISPLTHPFCLGCRRLRLTSHGELRGCLMQERGLDLRTLLRSGAPDAALEEALHAALALKAQGRSATLRQPMIAIGG